MPARSLLRWVAVAALIVLAALAIVLRSAGTSPPAGAQAATETATPTSTPSAVGEWRFDEGSGSAVKDSSPYGNDGVAYNAEWVTGVSGYALHFDGTDASYVEVPNASDLTPRNHLIIDVWIKPDSYPQTYTGYYIVYKGDMQQTGCFGERSYMLGLGGSAPGQIEFDSTPEGEDCQHEYLTDGGVVAVNEWNHVTVDLNTWEGKVRIFVNGQLVLTDSYPQKPIKVGDSPLRIGGMFRSWQNQFHFPGSIDEVKIEGDGAPVGGVAELPPLAGISADQASGPADGPGWSAGDYALAGALAAAVLAVAAGAWYARRRWLR